MRGDFSRIRFNRLKGYTAVLEQQGRVALDADANEQCFIDDYLRGRETVDVDRPLRRARSMTPVSRSRVAQRRDR